MPVKIVGRNEWGALPCSVNFPELKTPIMNVIMTKTGTEACTSEKECKEQIRKLQQYHITQGHGDIPYNFIITPDSLVYEGRGWNKTVPTPPTRPEFNNKALVIAHIGDFPESDMKWRWMIRTTFELIDLAIMNKTVDWEFKFMEIGAWISNEGYDKQLIE